MVYGVWGLLGLECHTVCTAFTRPQWDQCTSVGFNCSVQLSWPIPRPRVRSHWGGGDKRCAWESGMTRLLLTAAANLFLCAAGAGLLSFPFAVKSQGIVLTCITTIACAAASFFTDLIYISFAHKHRDFIKDGSISEVAQAAAGTGVARAALFTIVLGNLGAIIGFLILIGDILVPLGQAVCTDSSSTLCHGFQSRAAIILLFALVVALPLSSLASFQHMAASSALAIITIVLLAAVIVRQGVCNPAPATDLPHDDLLFRTGWSVMLGIPIAIFSLGNHSQVVQIYAEVSRADPDQGRLVHYAICAASCSCVVLYLCTGIFGFLAFGNRTQGDVLLNFGVGDWLAAMCRLLMAVHIAVALPLQVMPLRTVALRFYYESMGAIGTAAAAVGGGNPELKSPSTHSLLHPNAEEETGAGAGAVGVCQPQQPQKQAGARQGQPEPVGDNDSDRLPLIPSAPSALARLTCTSLLIMPCAFLAIAVPQVATLFGLLGASEATLQIYIVPGLMLMHSAPASNTFVGAGSEAGAGKRKGDRQGDPCVAFDEEEELLYVPSEFRWRYRLGAALIGFGLCVAVLGTYTFLFD